ncbi:DHA2 family efflux MFS transporter permease subunit [Corynebacterium vitaeruminis]|uniref:DHA2 family efflux MFS transporter permease subunit n=1 Tax=Corynebacterium vitaeruminis TaxID=38305 RepID=UPI0023F4F479|nr:DHA2 family efflux MFS transporter permease subunit [Corynebacterium vitaeruminis]
MAKRERVHATTLPLPEAQAWPALIALCVGFFMILLDQTIVSVATPALQTGLGANYNEVVWVTSAYLLTFAVPLLVTGRLGDRFGPRSLYLSGMVVFTLSSLACGLSPSMTWLIIARAVQGLGAAMLTPQTMSVINRIFARERRGAALGVWGMTAGVANLTGPVLGGIITESIGWQWIFFINVPFGVLSVLLVYRYVPVFPTTERKVDPASIVLSVLAVFLLVFGLQQGETEDWALWIWVCLLAGLGFGWLFLRQQSRAEHKGNDPLMPLKLFSFHNFSMGNVAIFAMGFVVAGTPLPIMLYLQHVHGMSPLAAGCMMIPQAFSSLTLSPYIGRKSDSYSPNKLAAMGYAISGLAYLGMFAVMQFSAPVWWVLVVTLFIGIGNSFVWSPNSTSTMRDLSPQLMGVGSGVYNTTRQLGSVLGSAAIGAVLQWRVNVTDLGAAYGQSVAVAALALLVGIWAALAANNRELSIEKRSQQADFQ